MMLAMNVAAVEVPWYGYLVGLAMAFPLQAFFVACIVVGILLWVWLRIERWRYMRVIDEERQRSEQEMPEALRKPHKTGARS
jgi:hypothetical protein